MHQLKHHVPVVLLLQVRPVPPGRVHWVERPLHPDASLERGEFGRRQCILREISEASFVDRRGKELLEHHHPRARLPAKPVLNLDDLRGREDVLFARHCQYLPQVQQLFRRRLPARSTTERCHYPQLRPRPAPSVPRRPPRRRRRRRRRRRAWLRDQLRGPHHPHQLLEGLVGDDMVEGHGSALVNVGELEQSTRRRVPPAGQQ